MTKKHSICKNPIYSRCSFTADSHLQPVFIYSRRSFIAIAGVCDKLISNIDELNKRGLIYGASVTLTTENINEVSSDEFIENLSKRKKKLNDCEKILF